MFWFHLVLQVLMAGGMSKQQGRQADRQTDQRALTHTFGLLAHSADNVADGDQHLAEKLVGALHAPCRRFAAIEVLPHLLPVGDHQAPPARAHMSSKFSPCMLVLELSACFVLSSTGVDAY